LLRKTSRTFHDPQNVSSTTLCTARALLNLLYMASPMTNTLDQVYCTQRCNIHTHYTWNAKCFKIYCHCVSVSKSPNLALHALGNLNHNQILGLSSTIPYTLISRSFQDQSHFQDLLGPGNLGKINQGLSRIFQEVREP